MFKGRRACDVSPCGIYVCRKRRYLVIQCPNRRKLLFFRSTFGKFRTVPSCRVQNAAAILTGTCGEDVGALWGKKKHTSVTIVDVKEALFDAPSEVVSVEEDANFQSKSRGFKWRQWFNLGYFTRKLRLKPGGEGCTLSLLPLCHAQSAHGILVCKRCREGRRLNARAVAVSHLTRQRAQSSGIGHGNLPVLMMEADIDTLCIHVCIVLSARMRVLTRSPNILRATICNWILL